MTPDRGDRVMVAVVDDYSAQVLDVVDAIPPGRVMSYGDVAEYLGSGGPRQVGRVLARYGGGTAWWRVIRADGRPPAGHEADALAHYLAEATPLLSTARTAPCTPSGMSGGERGVPGVQDAGRGSRQDSRSPRDQVRVDMRRARWAGPR